MIQDNKFNKLQREIERGQIQHYISSIIPVLLAVVIGRFIGTYCFGSAEDIANLWDALPSLVISITIFSSVLSVIIWHFKTAKYQKERQRRAADNSIS